MALSPMQQIFILLEDEKQVPLYRLNKWGHQARGVLAKLKKFGWASKIIQNKETYYQITNKGEQAIDEILRPLKMTGKWDGKWRLVMFDIPESKRGTRDSLRRALNKLGLGILQASVWISPNDIKDQIDLISKKFGLEKTLKFFEVAHNSNLDKTIIEKSWNLPGLIDEYRKFNFDATRILANISKDPNQRFTVKKLIFEYALILQKDPILPIEFRREDPLRNKANEIYLNLRSYI